MRQMGFSNRSAAAPTIVAGYDGERLAPEHPYGDMRQLLGLGEGNDRRKNHVFDPLFNCNGRGSIEAIVFSWTNMPIRRSGKGLL